MSSPKSLLPVLGLSFGGVGIVLCAAAAIILWMISIRLGQVTERLFGKMDHSLAVVRQRVVQTQDRVTAATITLDELQQTLRDWARPELVRRAALQLDAAEKTERLASTLQQADQWLEVSESSVGFLQDVLSIGASTTAPNDTTWMDELQQNIASLRAQLAEATEFVTTIHEHVAAASQEEAPTARVEQAVQVALRVVATLSSVGSRLGNLADRLSLAQTHVEELQAAAQRWRFLLTTGVTLLMVWMAAGQAALCRLAWNGWRETPAIRSG